MGRPDPFVLFSQTFVHPQLDEYVDEVLFSEPVVITACEFVEQSASSACSAVKLAGATSPPSFALEVFVHCEGETRFRRLCQPFLYSPSSSNILEVETVVTNHMVVRGMYRSLSLVVYGNTAEDLGQFSIEVDLDGSMANTVNSLQGNLEDLPAGLRKTDLSLDESVSLLRTLSLRVVPSDIPIEIKQILQLAFKILESPGIGAASDAVISSLMSAVFIHASPVFYSTTIVQKQFGIDILRNNGDVHHVLEEAKMELSDIFRGITGNPAVLSLESLSSETEVYKVTSKHLVDSLSQYFKFDNTSENVGHSELSQNKNTMLWLSVAFLLCSARESCFHFVQGGGMKQLGHAFIQCIKKSTALKLMLLGVIEQATRHSIGCEGFLGWWPREDENIPSGSSDGYNQLLKLLLQNQRHDIASLSTYILNRLRFYEIACRYEFSVLSALEGLSTSGRVTSATLDMLAIAKFQLKKLLKLINLCGPIEDPAPVSASRSLLLDDNGLLSYKATSGLINMSNCCFSNRDVDTNLLSLLKERGFLPLSAALLSSSIVRSEAGEAMDLFMDIVSSIEAIVLSLLFSRSGLIFLLRDPDISVMIIRVLEGFLDRKEQEFATLRYAYIRISKGFFCHPREVGVIVELHLKAINAIDRLITSTPNTEEFLWILWELCDLSRSDSGRQALLALVHFPEAFSVLMATLYSVKDLDPVTVNNNAGASPLNLAICHAAAEILEVIVTDSTALSMCSWIRHAKELHRVLHSASPGSNKKDAPARLLEWIDAGVVYHRNGAIGLLRYAAVLASGGDAHMASTSLLASDVMDVDDVGDSSSSFDGNVIDNLIGKRITEKDFPGVILRDTSVVQLTTAFRILAFISHNSDVVAALYDEGAVMVIHAVLINCRLMLVRTSNIHDYLVDEGTEVNSNSDILLERNREQSIIDLLIPSLVVLVNLLKKLQEAKEQHRNTKLMGALLQLHREVSPKLAASATNLSYHSPSSTLGFEAICHLIASALACWPIYGWTPGLFHYILDNLHVATGFSLGPKEICSLLCLLNDLFPDEGFWLWKNGVPLLSVSRALAVGTILGPQKQKEIDWYLQGYHREKLLGQLTPHFTKLAKIILHCAMSTLFVIQDMLRVFIARMSCLNTENSLLLLRPTILWINECLSQLSSSSDDDAYKVYRLLTFLALLLEHPHTKPLLLAEGAVHMLSKVLERCICVTYSGESLLSETTDISRRRLYLLRWCIPVFRCISRFCDCQMLVQRYCTNERHIPEKLTAEDSLLFLSYVLKFCKVLPAGQDLVHCLLAFENLVSCPEGQSALLSIFVRCQASGAEVHDSDGRSEKNVYLNLINAIEWKDSPPLLCCWSTLVGSIASKDINSAYAIEAIGILSSAVLRFCIDAESINFERIEAIKFFFGSANSGAGTGSLLEKGMKYIEEVASLSESTEKDDMNLSASVIKKSLDQVKESANLLMLLLQKPVDTIKKDDITTSVRLSLAESNPVSRIHRITGSITERSDDYDLGEFGDKFLWECPENLPDRLAQSGLPMKRKISSLEGPNRRARGDVISSEAVATGSFSRSSIPSVVPSSLTRRDTFRQRKPNTSRPPSMHVDDYVARERNADSNNNPNVIAVPRIGSSSGRPPSIHVDEFMARQRERQNPVAVAVSDTVLKDKAEARDNKSDAENVSKPRQLKPDLDDDLQGLDIVFDAEESEPDDKLPFPQPDDGILQPAPVVEHDSPHSIVEETESEVNENSHFSQLGAPLTSNADEHAQSEFSSRMSASRPERPLNREPSISSEKKYVDRPEDGFSVKHSNRFNSASAVNSGYPASVRANASMTSVPFPVEPRVQSNFYSRSRLPSVVGSQGIYDPKVQLVQPPLPPMPPPPTISHGFSQVGDFVANRPTFHVQLEYPSSATSSSANLTASSPLPESKYARTSMPSPSGSTRPQPPLPPTPPPFFASGSTSSSSQGPPAQSLVYNQMVAGATDLQQAPIAPSGDPRLGNNISVLGTMMTSYPPPPLVPPLLFNRPSSAHIGLYGNTSAGHLAESLPSNLKNPNVALPSLHTIPSLGRLQPLQPPQIPRPQQQQIRPLITAPLQSDQGVSLIQSPFHIQMPPLQVLQQPQVSPATVYYQTQQENISALQTQQAEHSQAQALNQPGDAASQQQDSGMSLQDFFKSPEAIQSLLSDRDKLCQLLEQHPKLMQMLQERLGQL